MFKKATTSANHKLLAGLTILFSSNTFAAWNDLNMTEGVTAISKEVFDLHMLIFWICVAIGLVVFGIMFYSMFAFTKKKNPNPATFHENTKVELAWTVVPFLILVFMAIPASNTLTKIYDDTEGDINIQVVGYQWKWQYKYLEDDIDFFSNLTTDWDEIYNKTPKGEFYLEEVDEAVVIPVGKKIRFLITANDVIHSWWVPDFAVKQDAIPGFINTAWTNVPEPGIFRGACTELCGIKHAFMPVVVRAVEREEFDAFIAEKVALAEEERLLTSKVWTKEELMARGEGFY